MSARTWIVVALLASLVGAGCRKSEPGSAPADPIVPVGEPGSQTLQLGDVTVVDNRGETPVAPLGDPPDPVVVWDGLGVTTETGRVTVTNDRFRRIEDPDGGAGARVAAHVQRLVADGWAQQTGNDPLRVNLARDGLELSLVGNGLADGGAGIGFSLAQDWATLGLPPEGTTMAASGPADCHGTWMEGRTAPDVMAQVEQSLVAAGWTHAVEELIATREGIRDVAVRWFVRNARSLRVQVHAQDDGVVQLRVDAGWRVLPAAPVDPGSP